MYSVSQQYHNLIASGAEQNLLIVFNDLYLSSRDQDIEASGATLNEFFNTSTDIEIGEVSSSTFSVRLMNYEGALNQFQYGEGRPYIGVKTGDGTYTRPSGATAYTVWTDSDGVDHTIVGYSDHATIDDTTVSTDNEAVNIVWAKDDIVYIQAQTLMYEYQYDVATAAWTVASGAVNPFMATKASEGVKWQNHLMTIYLEDGTTEEWEYCPLGVFNFVMPSKRQVPIIDVSAYDRMTLFDKDATDFLGREWQFPITLEYLFTELCGYVNVPFSDEQFTNYDMSFTALPAFGTTATCRDILSYIAEASGSVARFDRDGILRLKWYGDDEVQQYGTASGDIATFTDGADEVPLKSLVLNIVPTQTGTGDPSPDNIRPISGWTGAKVYDYAENYQTTAWRQGSISINNGGEISSTTRCRSLSFPVDAGEYHFGVPVGYKMNTRVYSGQPASSSNFIVGESEVNFQTSDFEAAYTAVRYIRIVIAREDDAELEPSEVPTVLVYRVGTLYPITWSDSAGTVYGGTLDVVRGKLTDTHLIREMTGVNDGDGYVRRFTGKASSTSFTEYYTSNLSVFSDYGKSEGEFSTYYVPNTQLDKYGFACSVAPSRYGDAADSFCARLFIASNGTTQLRMRFPLSWGIDTVDKANQWLADLYAAGTPCVYWVKRRTNLEYDLTPTEVTSLLGENNIWADCGSIANCEYPIDPDSILYEAPYVEMNGYDKAEYITPVVDQITSKLANGEVYTEGSGENVYTILANSLLASDSSRYGAILDKLQRIEKYTPIVASVIDSDPSVESGDRVKVFGEIIPLMSQTLSWRTAANSEFVATGLPHRELPSSLDRYNYAVAYNANTGKSNSDMLGEVHYALYADGTGLTQVVSNHTSELSNITTDVGNLSSALDDYIADSEGTIEGAKITNQHVRYGVVGYDANNDPIAGVAVGETITYTPSNNLFDVVTATTYTRYFTSANKWSVSTGNRSYAFACQPSTQYTVSCSNPNITIFRVGDIADNPIPESTACQARNVTRMTTDGAITITTSDDATYIVIQINASAFDVGDLNLQIEYGDTATEYAPFTGGKDIVTIDNLGVFTARNITFFVNGNNVAQFGTNGMTLGDKWAWFVEADGSISHKYIG